MADDSKMHLPSAVICHQLIGKLHMQDETGPLSADRIKLTIGALGVVYGDIGTSTLYHLQKEKHLD